MIAWLLLVNSVSAVGACAADLKTGAHRHMRRGEPRPPPHSATSISIEDGSIPLGQVAHSGHHFLDVGVRKRGGQSLFRSLATGRGARLLLYRKHLQYTCIPSQPVSRTDREKKDTLSVQNIRNIVYIVLFLKYK